MLLTISVRHIGALANVLTQNLNICNGLLILVYLLLILYILQDNVTIYNELYNFKI
jgi:hypothetical protein